MATKTSPFGTKKRESHDASAFYGRHLYQGGFDSVWKALAEIDQGKVEGCTPKKSPPEGASVTGAGQDQTVTDDHGQVASPAGEEGPADWLDRIYGHTSEQMAEVPDYSVALAFTSPPYNDGKDYDPDLSLTEYLLLMARVGAEVYRVLKRGGRYVINVANLGRKPYIPLHAFFYPIMMKVGFLPAGEIIWQKGRGANGNCAWGSWRSAKSPRLRDLHEYLLVFVKESFSRPNQGQSDLTGEEFMSSTLSVWEIRPESARKVGHPAPFPVELAGRVIKLYSYVGETILDPFCGSGTTCVAAKELGRSYVGYEVVPEYCQLARQRIARASSTPGGLSKK